MSREFNDVSVVGMHFREREGVPAKAIVGNMLEGAEITLEREPDNRFDGFALKALYEGQHIGYVEASAACFISPEIDEGFSAKAVVTRFEERRNNLHPILTVSIDEE